MTPRRRSRLLRRTVYWMLVLAVSLVLVILLLGFFESRDASEVGAAGRPPAQRTCPRDLPIPSSGSDAAQMAARSAGPAVLRHVVGVGHDFVQSAHGMRPCPRTAYVP